MLCQEPPPLELRRLFLFFLIISGLDPAGLCQWFHLIDDKG